MSLPDWPETVTIDDVERNSNIPKSWTPQEKNVWLEKEAYRQNNVKLSAYVRGLRAMITSKEDQAEMGVNFHGLDVAHFRKAIDKDLGQPLQNYKPYELAQVLARLSVAAHPDAILDPALHAAHPLVEHIEPLLGPTTHLAWTPDSPMSSQDKVVLLKEKDYNLLRLSLHNEPKNLKKLVEDLADAFLHWPIPEDISPDGGLALDPNSHHVWSAVGTNLLNQEQARGMAAYMLYHAESLAVKDIRESHWAVQNPGMADQYRQEALAMRRALGFATDAQDVSPSDLVSELSRLITVHKETSRSQWADHLRELSDNAAENGYQEASEAMADAAAELGSEPWPLHPDDMAAFGTALDMSRKLKKARQEKGQSGWNDPDRCSVEYLSERFADQLLRKKNPNILDLMNYLMMLHVREADPELIRSFVAEYANHVSK